MDLELTGRVALVAGGGRGLGRAITLALAREGAQVAPLSRTASEVEAVAGEARKLGVEAEGIAADLTDGASVDAALGRINDRLGQPTIVVLCAAAVYDIRKLHTLDADTARELVDVDLTTAVELCRKTIPDMMLANFGRIIAIGSLAARTGVAGGTIYSATKAALEGLVRGLAVDYSRRGITANVCNVGFADTERLQMRVSGDEEARARLESATAVRRLTRPDEIADVVCFLASPRASSITGAVVDATGGAHLNNLW